MEKIPWVDTTKCKKAVDCKAAKYCKHEAFRVQPEADGQPGVAVDYPKVDLELCKRCGDCEHACAGNAVKMIQL